MSTSGSALCWIGLSAATELCCLPRVQIRRNKRQGFVATGTILIILLVLALLSGLSGRGDWLFDGTGYYGGGGIGLLLVIVIILVVLVRI